MVIESHDLQRREDALRMVLRNIQSIEKDISKSSKEDIELMTFIPEGLVGVTIGPNGKTISRIRQDTGIGVVINQRV